MNYPEILVIHCSATKNEISYDIEEIRKWHLQRGWKDVGYHYVIKRDGTIQMGRLETEVGAHVRGHNQNSLGICLIGNDNFTSKQYTSVDRLYRDICSRYSIMPDDVYGHYEFTDEKTCPNLEMDSLRERLWKVVN